MLDKAKDGQGVSGYWATELKVYMEAGAVTAKAKMVTGK